MPLLVLSHSCLDDASDQREWSRRVVTELQVALRIQVRRRSRPERLIPHRWIHPHVRIEPPEGNERAVLLESGHAMRDALHGT